MIRTSVLVCATLAIAGSAAAAPIVDSARVRLRVFNDAPGSNASSINNYPALVGVSDANFAPPTAFANLHVWRFSSNGGGSYTQFANNDQFSFSADVTITSSAGGRGEAGLSLSPWFSQEVDGRFNLRTTDGEVAVFGGRLPFYSFTAAQGITYVAGTTVRLGIDYEPRDLNAGNPGRIRYNYNNLTSGWLNFDQGNPAEDPPYGLWGILNQATAGGYMQVFAGQSGTAGGLSTTWENITYIPAPGAAALLGLGGLLAARRRR